MSSTDILTLLRQADPVDPAALPTADSPPARALAERITGRRHRRVALTVAFAVFVLAIVVAAPAIGDLFGREDVRFEQTPPAAPVAKREFADMSVGAPAGMDPRVVAGETRLAATFELGGVPRRVWVAPTATGGFCYLYERLGGGCDNTPRRRDHIQLVGSFVLRLRAQTPAMEDLAGVVFDPTATALRLTFEDERTIPLRFVYVSKPIDAGFFAYKPTPEQQVAGHRPTEVVLLDADGAMIGQEAIDWKSEARKAAELRKLSRNRPPPQRGPTP